MITAQGVEGFVYNRTPAYDAIVERMMKHEQEDKDGQKSFTDSNSASKSGNPDGPRLRKVAPDGGVDTPSDDKRSNDSNRELFYQMVAENQITLLSLSLRAMIYRISLNPWMRQNRAA